MTTAPRYQSVAFAGGGCRCVWQIGFWETAAPRLGIEPLVVAAVSAGAATACLVFAGVADGGLQSFKAHAARNKRNVYPRNFLAGKPVFPHEDIYRDTILENLDAAALRRLHAGPDVRIVLARMPERLGVRTGVVAGFIAAQLEQLVLKRVHVRFPRKVGFIPEIISVRDCRTPEAIADLILQSSCTPPFTTLYVRDSRPVLDGCIVDGAPVDALDGSARPTLVLLSRLYPPGAIPEVQGRTYVRPSEPIPVDAWDYTNPVGIQLTYDLGRRDGERFAASVDEQL